MTDKTKPKMYRGDPVVPSMRVNFNIPQDVYDWVVQQAAAEGMWVNQWLRRKICELKDK